VAIGLGCLVVSGYCFYKARSTEPTETKSDTETPGPDGKKAEAFEPSKREYYFGGIVGFAAALVGVVGGGYALGKLPLLTASGSTPDVRVVAACGGGIGVLQMILGFGLFVLWFGTLVDWLTNRSSPEAWKVITAILLFLIGSGIAFLSTQLLRVDERNDQTMRRIAFGTNAALSVLLLFVGLIALNVMVGLKLPARLDTTSSGFYSLHADTTELIKNLTTDVMVYTTISEETSFDDEDKRLAADLKRLFEQCRSVNPRRFQYQVLSPTLNKSDLAKLQNEHAEFKRSDLGMLVVAEGKPGRFVPYTDLIETQRQSSKITFLGEPKLVSLLLAVTEDKDQTVYFVQGHGEISIRPPDSGIPIRTGNRMSDALQRVDAVVKPLSFELGNPKVPDDAAVVVLADPTAPLPTDHVEAIRSYMSTPRSNKKKGKLVVLSSPHPNLNGKGVMTDPGLNALLGEYGIALGSSYVYFSPSPQYDQNETDLFPVAGGGPDGTVRNPVVAQFQRRVPVFVNCREISVMRERPGGDYLFASNPGRVTWIETEAGADPLQAWKEMTTGDRTKAREAIQHKQAIQEPRPLAASASDAGVGRVVVYGSGDAFADTSGPSSRKYAVNPEMLAATVNWLRERPTAANITGKEVTEYQANKSMSGSQALLLPVFGTLIATVVLGLGVWVYRRK
jgi:hypothetical protein